MDARETLLKLQEITVLRYDLTSARRQKWENKFSEETFEKIYDDYKKNLSQKELEEIRKNVKEEQEKRKEIELPTPYQNRDSYTLILDFWRIIKDILPTIKFKHKETGQIKTLEEQGLKIITPYFGTVQIGSINAVTYPCDNNERLIVFEMELMTFCHLLCKIIARTFPHYDPKEKKSLEYYKEKIEERIENEPEITQRFKELIIAFVTTGKATTAPQYLLDTKYYPFLNHLRLAMEVFIVGHEYAHILLGHVDENDSRQNLLMQDVENVLFSWNQESNADELGLPLMLEGLKNIGYQNDFVSYCGAEAFFSAFEVIERAKCLIQSREEKWYWKNCSENGKVGDHPPSEKRRTDLRMQMTKIYGEISIETSQIIESMIKTLWEKIKPDILSNRKELHLEFLSYQVENNFAQRKYSDALETLEKILEINANHLPALFGKGNIFQHLNRLGDANQCYDAILKIDNDNVGALVQKSNVLFLKNEYEKALQTANEALEKEHQNPHALYAKGMALDHLKRFAKAIECFKSILDQDESDIPALLRIAFAYALMMEPKTAITYYDKVLEIEPEHPDAIEQKITLLEHLK